MIKFGRSFRLTIDPADGGDMIVITMPMTIRFTIQKSNNSSLNSFKLDIFNLSDKNRDRIFQDRYNGFLKTVTLEAGYDSLATVFIGHIFEANTSREGPSIVTSIESLDGYYDVFNTLTFQTFTRGATIGDVLQFLSGQFPTLAVGAVGSFDEKALRPVVLNGNTYDLLKKYSSNQVFVENGKVFVLGKEEVIEGELPVISAETGLLESPRRDDGYLTVTTLFEPRIALSQMVELKSAVTPVYNGKYKVLGVIHQGTISGAVNGPCTTTLNLFTGTQTFGEFKKVEQF